MLIDTIPLVVDAAGNLRFTGRLGNGAPISGSGAYLADGTMAFEAAPLAARRKHARRRA